MPLCFNQFPVVIHGCHLVLITVTLEVNVPPYNIVSRLIEVLKSLLNLTQLLNGIINILGWLIVMALCGGLLIR